MPAWYASKGSSMPQEIGMCFAKRFENPGVLHASGSSVLLVQPLGCSHSLFQVQAHDAQAHDPNAKGHGTSPILSSMVGAECLRMRQHACDNMLAASRLAQDSLGRGKDDLGQYLLPSQPGEGCKRPSAVINEGTPDKLQLQSQKTPGFC